MHIPVAIHIAIETDDAGALRVSTVDERSHEQKLLDFELHIGDHASQLREFSDRYRNRGEWRPG